MASRIMKLAAVAVLVGTAAGSAPADWNGTSLDVNITVDGELVPFARCYITAASLLLLLTRSGTRSSDAGSTSLKQAELCG